MVNVSKGIMVISEILRVTSHLNSKESWSFLCLLMVGPGFRVIIQWLRRGPITSVGGVPRLYLDGQQGFNGASREKTYVCPI